MIQVTMALGLSVALTTAVQSPKVVDLPAAIIGDWQILDAEAPQASQDCTKAQRFSLSADKREITLTEPWADFSARYRVVWVEPNRMLTIIEDEKRKNENGDPIMWWFNFHGDNAFQFRQYDWSPDQTTSAVWIRCTPNK
jgi:hypothetical protein